MFFGSLNGKPVPMSARCGSAIDETRIGWPLSRAPPPAVAVNSSPFAALRTTPATRAPSAIAPIDTAYQGKP